MSWIQQQEELDYDTQTEYLAVLRAEAVDHFEDEREYYCEEHDYKDWNNACPFGPHAPAPLPDWAAIDPNYVEPPF